MIEESPPWALRWRSSTAFILTTVAAGMFTDLFLWGIIIPILPFLIEERLHIPPSQVEGTISWLLSSNSFAALLFSPFAGFLADKIYRRNRPFLAGLLALIFATVLLGFGATLRMLVVARILQGASGAIVWTVGLAICVETVGSDKLGLTMGSIWSIISIGSQVAPIIGGILYKYYSFRGVFVISISLLVVDLALRLLVIEKKVAAEHGNIDFQDSTRSSATTPVPSEESPLLDQPTNDCDSIYKIDINQSRLVKSIPLIACLRHAGLVVALVSTFAQAIVLSGFDAMVPIIATQHFGLNSFSTSLLFLALGVPEMLFGPPAGWLVDKKGTRFAALIGWGFLALGLIMLAIAGPDSNTVQNLDDTKALALYAILLTISGIGITITGAPSITEAGIVVEKYFKANKEIFGANGPYALLYGLNGMFFNAGFSLGPVMVAFFKPWIGYTGIYLILTSICVIITISSSLFLGRS